MPRPPLRAEVLDPDALSTRSGQAAAPGRGRIMFNKALLRFVQRGLTTGTVLALALGVASPAGATDPSLARRWALTRTSDGHLQVVRGIKVAIAQADADLGRTSTSVVSVEDDATVGVLGDPMRSDQWALDKVSYEAT